MDFKKYDVREKERIVDLVLWWWLNRNNIISDYVDELLRVNVLGSWGIEFIGGDNSIRGMIEMELEEKDCLMEMILNGRKIFEGVKSYV